MTKEEKNFLEKNYAKFTKALSEAMSINICLSEITIDKVLKIVFTEITDEDLWYLHQLNKN